MCRVNPTLSAKLRPRKRAWLTRRTGTCVIRRMIIDAWAQHPTLRHLNHPMFESLRRWTRGELGSRGPAGDAASGRCR